MAESGKLDHTLAEMVSVVAHLLEEGAGGGEEGEELLFLLCGCEETEGRKDLVDIELWINFHRT